MAHARAELARLLGLEKEACVTADLLQAAAQPPPIVIMQAQSVQAHANSQPQDALPEQRQVSNKRTSTQRQPESAEQEIRRLELTVNNLTEVNDRIMSQNIALLHDLEACQKAVRALRADNDTLAQSLKRSLQRLEGSS